MRWVVHGERSLYESPWVNLAVADVEVPSGRRFEHHVIRAARPAVGVLVHQPDDGLLLLWRHRFITNAWGWEIPAGGVDDGESLVAAAQREVFEETGWVVTDLEHLVSIHPMNGICDQEFHIFIARDARFAGPPHDQDEAERVEWVDLALVRREMQTGNIPDGFTIAAISFALAFEHIS